MGKCTPVSMISAAWKRGDYCIRVSRALTRSQGTVKGGVGSLHPLWAVCGLEGGTCSGLHDKSGVPKSWHPVLLLPGGALCTVTLA